MKKKLVLFRFFKFFFCCLALSFRNIYLCKFLLFGFDLLAVQNERQPRNTATIRPEAFRDMDQSRALREAAVAVGVFA